MKSVVMLWVACLQEAGSQYCVRTCHDEAYALSRIEDEGIAFLTITLPSFEKDLLKALSLGRIESNLFSGFRRRGGLPAFLSGFLSRVFDNSGQLRRDVNPGIIRSLRQILLLCSKIELPVSKRRERLAARAYITTDAELVDVDPAALEALAEASRALYGSFLAEVEQSLYSGDWTPRHSSGKLATRESYNARYDLLTWTERLQTVFPYWEDLLCNYHEIMDRGEDVTVLARDDEPPARMAFVPKTMKGPRTIVMEPSWMQFVQQGIFKAMEKSLHSTRNQRLASFFSWLDQEPNRELARIGSVDGSYATIDLSEASDRVSVQLVDAMLSPFPFLRKCVMACRSESVRLPDGQIIRLNKFASMGSSLCFPIESMVFFLIEAISWGKTVGIAPSALRVRGLPRMRTYGDDLIVPAGVARTLISELEAYGLKVNSGKSFTTGLFRESCGSDWFSGSNVSVIRLRHVLPESRHQHEAVQQGIDFHNRLYEAGWFSTASVVERALLRVRHDIPRVPVGTRVVALWSWDGPFVVRTSPTLHRMEFKALIARQRRELDPLEGYGALRKFFIPHGDEPRDEGHLERDGRSQCVGITIGWLASL